MGDVQKWMVAINLEEYASLFLEKRVDGKKLDRLNDRGLQVRQLNLFCEIVISYHMCVLSRRWEFRISSIGR